MSGHFDGEEEEEGLSKKAAGADGRHKRKGKKIEEEVDSGVLPSTLLYCEGMMLVEQGIGE